MSRSRSSGATGSENHSTDLPAALPATQNTAEPETFPVEELAARLNVPAWAFNGMMVRYGWGKGKELTEHEFVKAKKAFLEGPMEVK